MEIPIFTNILNWYIEGKNGKKFIEANWTEGEFKMVDGDVEFPPIPTKIYELDDPNCKWILHREWELLKSTGEIDPDIDFGKLEGMRGSVSEHLDKIGEYALLSAEEEQELLLQAVNGNDEALDKIINANLRFIVSIANQYQNRRLPLLQLFDISKQGLANAVKESASKPHNQRFIQFAVPYMRKAIEEAITANNE
jgi:DNA-directed RNA polymerase sigma subunit (sigma70/sigma32)